MKWTTYIKLLLILIGIGPLANAQPLLETNFKAPPNETKPRTWMHAMSGNMSKVGMTKDLEAIAAAGQGGILLFNIANRIPYGNVPYNSEAHHQIMKHAAEECEGGGCLRFNCFVSTALFAWLNLAVGRPPK